MKIEIHLKDFPNNIGVYLNEKTRLKLFLQLEEKFTLKEMSNKINIHQKTLENWKRGYEKDKFGNLNLRFMPVGSLKWAIRHIDISWDELESNITKIKVWRREKKHVIDNPKLPITDSKELREIILHIMCDGTGSHYAAYYNTDENAKKEFIEELTSVFGNASYNLYEDHVNFSLSIPYILSNYFKVDFHSKKCDIPKEFMQGNREQLIPIIRAFIIDEGCIDGSNIRLDSCNKEFLQSVKCIAQKLDYKTGKTWMSKGDIYRFNILAESIERLSKDMNFPVKTKQEALKFIVKNQKRGWKYKLPGETKTMILKELIKTNKSAVELSKKLNLPRGTINQHLRWLKSKKLIKIIGKSKYTYVYSIENNEKVNDFLRDISSLIKDKKIYKYGLSQLKILRLLNKNKLKFGEIKRKLQLSKSATYKFLKSLQKKGFIKKDNKSMYIISEQGNQILEMNEEKARYLLYSNMMI